VDDTALAKLTPDERDIYLLARRRVAVGGHSTVYMTRILLATIERLISQSDDKLLVAEGAGPLLDPDCRDGKCRSCVGAPCEHSCHATTAGTLDGARG
jgi:hypothetical protein